MPGSLLWLYLFHVHITCCLALKLHVCSLLATFLACPKLALLIFYLLSLFDMKNRQTNEQTRDWLPHYCGNCKWLICNEWAQSTINALVVLLNFHHRLVKLIIAFICRSWSKEIRFNGTVVPSFLINCLASSSPCVVCGKAHTFYCKVQMPYRADSDCNTFLLLIEHWL